MDTHTHTLRPKWKHNLPEHDFLNFQILIGMAELIKYEKLRSKYSRALTASENLNLDVRLS